MNLTLAHKVSVFCIVTLLHLAAGMGQTDIANILIKARAAINARDKNGWTPLYYAAALGQTNTAIALVYAGGIYSSH